MKKTISKERLMVLLSNAMDELADRGGYDLFEHDFYIYLARRIGMSREEMDELLELYR